MANNFKSTTPKNELDASGTYIKETIASRMKNRLKSMSKDRQNESLSTIYAKREPMPEDRLD